LRSAVTKTSNPAAAAPEQLPVEDRLPSFCHNGADVVLRKLTNELPVQVLVEENTPAGTDLVADHAACGRLAR
jgi:hypothetical protein